MRPLLRISGLCLIAVSIRAHGESGEAFGALSVYPRVARNGDTLHVVVDDGDPATRRGADRRWRLESDLDGIIAETTAREISIPADVLSPGEHVFQLRPMNSAAATHRPAASETVTIVRSIATSGVAVRVLLDAETATSWLRRFNRNVELHRFALEVGSVSDLRLEGIDFSRIGRSSLKNLKKIQLYAIESTPGATAPSAEERVLVGSGASVNKNHIVFDGMGLALAPESLVILVLEAQVKSDIVESWMFFTFALVVLASGIRFCLRRRRGVSPGVLGLACVCITLAGAFTVPGCDESSDRDPTIHVGVRDAEDILVLDDAASAVVLDDFPEDGLRGHKYRIEDFD